VDSIHPESTVTDEDLLAINLIGCSPALRDVADLVRRAAGHDVTVAIYGETGTGKELVAQALHYIGRRAAGPFIPVNCGALTDTLFESELFGHERGAFTDARREHDGLIEQADGGTLFLDEIEALSPRGQVSLLRFLQDRSYRKVGGRRQQTADVRIIVASNVPPDRLLADHEHFREDLYYRLNVLPVHLPSLRERREDIVPLAQHFLTIFRARFDLPRKYLGDAGMAWLLEQDWPGNVRELENTLQRGLLLAEGNEIGPRHLQMSMNQATAAGLQGSAPLQSLPFNEARARVLESFEHDYLQELLARNGGNVTRAARKAGKERRSLGRLLKKHHIDPSRYNSR
jgi:DNA-binding NtrC family response regulator